MDVAVAVEVEVVVVLVVEVVVAIVVDLSIKIGYWELQARRGLNSRNELLCIHRLQL